MPYEELGSVSGAFDSGGLTGGRLYTALQSSKFVEGSEGWRILPDGGAEFNDVTVRGVIEAASGNLGTMTVDGNITVDGSHYITSNTYSASTGWRIWGDGDARFGGLDVADILSADDIRSGGSGASDRLYFKDASGTTHAWFNFQTGDFTINYGLVVPTGKITADTIEITDVLFSGDSSGSAANTTARNILDVAGWAWHNRPSGTPLYLQRSSTGGPMISLIFGTAIAATVAVPAADRLQLRTGDNSNPYMEINGTSGDIIWYDNSGNLSFMYDESITAYRWWPGGSGVGNEMMRLRNAGNASTLYLSDGLDNVGNHETLRLNRGTGTTLQLVGYYSSYEFDPETGERRKTDVQPIDLDQIDITKVRPVVYRRTDTEDAKERGGVGAPEMGFILEDLAAANPILTTKPGSQVGSSPDEIALIALLWQRVDELEKRCSCGR